MLNSRLKSSGTKYAALVAAGLFLATAPAANADGLGLGLGGLGLGGLGLGGGGSGGSGSGSGGIGVGVGVGIGNQNSGIGVGAGLGLGQKDSLVSAGAGIVTSGGIDSQTTAGVTVGNLDPGNLNATVDVNTSLAEQVQGQIGTGLQVAPVGVDLGVNINQGDSIIGPDPDGPGSPDGPGGLGDDGTVGDMISALSLSERQQLLRRCDQIMQSPASHSALQVTVCELAM